MLIVALVLAVIGLAALVTAVVTSNELVAWVCIGASGLGVLLLIIDAIRDRARRRVGAAAIAAAETEVIEPVFDADDSLSSTEIIEPVDEAYESIEEADEVTPDTADADYPDDYSAPEIEDHPDEVVYDDPDHDTPSDDEQDFPESAEAAAIHILDEQSLVEDETIEQEYRDVQPLDEERDER
ncbi:MAG: hypothetical protein ACR2JM_12830 [Mycobacterium sp.]